MPVRASEGVTVRGPSVLPLILSRTIVWSKCDILGEDWGIKQALAWAAGTGRIRLPVYLRFNLMI